MGLGKVRANTGITTTGGGLSNCAGALDGHEPATPPGRWKKALAYMHQDQLNTDLLAFLKT